MLKSKKHQEDYNRLAKQPFYRLFKVAFAFLGFVLVVRAVVAVASSVCSESTSCDIPSATGNSIMAGVGAVLGLIVLFWLIRRLAIYIAYGNTKRKADDEAITR